MSTTAPSLLEIKKLSVAYGAIKALHGVNLQIN